MKWGVHFSLPPISVFFFFNQQIVKMFAFVPQVLLSSFVQKIREVLKNVLLFYNMNSTNFANLLENFAKFFILELRFYF
jgi:hypothetical protein